MKHYLPLLLTAVGALAVSPKAAAEEIYKDNHVRFTLVDEGTVRLEYAPDGKFVDNKSFVAVVRQHPAVKHTLKETSKQVTITTNLLKLVYKKNDGPFDAKNLTITYNVPSAQSANVMKGTWHPGMEQQQNLKGTYRTLDGYSGAINVWNNEPIPLEDGLLARDGWTLIDDSKGFLFTEEADGWDWVTTRPAQAEGAPEAQDWYFMAYGHNYKAALKSYTKFAGNMPLPPRYTFGYWWSRYWSYSDQDFRDLIDNFHHLNIPLDVLVIDMDWHPISPEAGGGWTGWDWNESLFPDYKQFLAYLDEQGVKTTMNLHPADGVRPYEKKYQEFLQRYGRDANAMASIREQWAPDGAVEWLGSDKQMVKALFDTYLHPYMKEGVDFWWLDWQQWLTDKQVKDLSNTWWCNYLFFNDMERNGDKRPMLYHRWGGLGNHRYQIGFSGDALMTWESLDYLPYFNSTASNVLYGYWSHDIGGHWNQEQGKGVDAEMYTRAMQMAQFLPVMRSHSTKDASLNKEPWAFDNTTQQRIIATVNGRYALVPYIYTMARKAYETGESLCRPLYYDYPEEQAAYEHPTEFLFGDNMLIAPVTKPVEADGFAHTEVWLPAGDWTEYSTGERNCLETEGVSKAAFSMDEYPVYVKSGSILPYYSEVKNLGGNDQPVVVRVFPGADSGSFSLYEDNGEDKKYETEYATTPLIYTRAGNVLKVTIGERNGQYVGMPAKRHYTLALPFELAPERVVVDGKALKYTFDAKDMETRIDLGEVDCSKGLTVEITLPSGPDAEAAVAVLNGCKGKLHRIQTAVADYKQRNAGMVYTKDFGTLEATPLRLQYHPENMVQILLEYDKLMQNINGILDEQMHNADDAARFMRFVFTDY
ncbi:MAG: glycoside hydrolase family 31 protein [Bacteroidales bacterium]|nr:glycoside hydrolase family 31 protein [Bacteroidales bacterium]